MFKRFTAGVAVGYVLGARAGEKRYDQITELADRAMDIPFVERLADSGRSMAMDQGRRMVAGIKDRARWNGSDTSQVGDDTEDDEVDADYDDYDDDVNDDHNDADSADDADEVGDVQAEEDDHDDVDDVEDDQFLDDEDTEEDEVDEMDDGDDGDDGGGAEPEEERPNGRSRGRIGALASAARDRGRVD